MYLVPSLPPPSMWLLQGNHLTLHTISLPQSRSSIVVLTLRCCREPEENPPCRGPRAGCIGVRGHRCVWDRRLSVDGSLAYLSLPTISPTVMTSVLSICKPLHTERSPHWCVTVSNEWNTNAGTQLARNHPSVLPPMVTMWHVSLVAHPTDSDFGHWFLNGWGPILDVILIGSILVSVFVWRSFGLQRGGDTFMEFWPAVVSKYAPIQHR